MGLIAIPIHYGLSDSRHYFLDQFSSKIKMQTIQYRKSRISEMKEDEYTKSLAKNQVCAIFHMRDIRKFYPNF